MKVKASSWHYRMQKWAPWDVPGNLCGYFWSLVAITVGSPIVATLVAIVYPFIWAGQKLNESLLEKQAVSWPATKAKLKRKENEST